MSKNNVFNDGMSITINFKWLLQIIAGVAIITFSFWKIEGRIQALERNMQVALEEIDLHEQERKKDEQEHLDQMEQRMSWYEKELNLNPFSWGREKKNK